MKRPRKIHCAHHAARRAFTLVELLVVIAIIGLLSTVAVVSLSSARVKARDTRRIADLKQMVKALELYYDDHGYYPQAGCGWDCNGYWQSYDVGWDSLAADLASYIGRLPIDPINKAVSPWDSGGYSYAYGNVGRNTYTVGYDLVAQLEDTNNSLRCGVQNYQFNFIFGPWCGPYSTQLYVLHPY